MGCVFMLSVPDAWISNWKPGYVWDAGAGIVANPQNGHGTWWPGAKLVNGQQYDHGLTWGGDYWITPAGIALCDPSAFAVLSPRMFNSQGYAPNGRHASQSAAIWVQAGGNSAAAAALVAMFPAIGPNPGPGPQPTPVPVPSPTPTPVPSPTGHDFDTVMAAMAKKWQGNWMAEREIGGIKAEGDKIIAAGGA